MESRPVTGGLRTIAGTSASRHQKYLGDFVNGGFVHVTLLLMHIITRPDISAGLDDSRRIARGDG